MPVNKQRSTMVQCLVISDTTANFPFNWRFDHASLTSEGHAHQQHLFLFMIFTDSNREFVGYLPIIRRIKIAVLVNQFNRFRWMIDAQHSQGNVGNCLFRTYVIFHALLAQLLVSIHHARSSCYKFNNLSSKRDSHVLCIHFKVYKTVVSE